MKIKFLFVIVLLFGFQVASSANVVSDQMFQENETYRKCVIMCSSCLGGAPYPICSYVSDKCLYPCMQTFILQEAVEKNLSIRFEINKESSNE